MAAGAKGLVNAGGAALNSIKITGKTSGAVEFAGTSGKIVTVVKDEKSVNISKATESGGKASVSSTEGAANAEIKIAEKNAGHIFRDAEGHLPDTAANRNLLTDVGSNKGNCLGTDKYGTEWYAKTQPDGTQVWAQVRNGEVTNGGLNQTPKTFNSQTGLSSPTKP